MGSGILGVFNPYEFIDGWLYYHGRRVSYVPAFDTRGRMQKLKGCVLHYGAGTQQSDIAILTGEDHIYVSAHLSVSRTGCVVQMANLFDVCLHAGDGRHKSSKPHGGRTINYCFAGIEMENYGWLNEDRGDYAGRGDIEVLKADCIQAAHPERGGGPMWWPNYPLEQEQAVEYIVEAMKAASDDMEFLVGHDEVSRHKFDPGPAWNMDFTRAMTMLRKD